jgi:hypothetical protein
VEQLNPRQQLSIPCDALFAVHKCIGREDDVDVRRLLEAEEVRS